MPLHNPGLAGSCTPPPYSMHLQQDEEDGRHPAEVLPPPRRIARGPTACCSCCVVLLLCERVQVSLCHCGERETRMRCVAQLHVIPRRQAPSFSCCNASPASAW